MMNGRIETRTAKDPAAYVAGFGDRSFWGGKYYRVELVEVLPGETKSGRKRFTIRFVEVE